MLMQTHLYQELPVYQDTQIGALKAIALKLTNDFNFDYQEVLSSLLASAGEQTQTINDQAILTYGHVTSLTEPVVIGFDFGKALPWAAGHQISQAIVLLVPVDTAEATIQDRLHTISAAIAQDQDLKTMTQTATAAIA
ncbi:transcriptional regulator [Lacticaseibacillus paracasei]|uniref:transcriptional regulator n=1 Tax=Lacticaseibacillus paracasei TaxID=1597 RepID=UPI001C48C5BB|nr:transcriptional regulator [Lacticaseibacillus paracasei]MDS0490458.1 transcriptional regulator [Lacticaseibacillus paracasei]QXJ67139.1 transcriptional regulator [Lacticaseibacillus paracasei subsp. paracasei]